MKHISEYINEQLITEGMTIRWTYDKVVWRWLDKNKNMNCLGGPMVPDKLSNLLKNIFDRYSESKSFGTPCWTMSDNDAKYSNCYAFVFTGNDSLYIISFRMGTGRDFEVDFVYKLEGADYNSQQVNPEMKRLFIDRDVNKKDIVETNKNIRELNQFYDDVKKGKSEEKTMSSTQTQPLPVPSGTPTTFDEMKAWLDSKSFTDIGQYSDGDLDSKIKNEFRSGPDKIYTYGDLTSKIGRRLYVKVEDYEFYYPIARGKDHKIDVGLTIDDLSKKKRLAIKNGDPTDRVVTNLEASFKMLSSLA